MECGRCKGLMVKDQFSDFKETYGVMWMNGWRCVNCGHAPLIEANRRLHDLITLVP
jgi:hypothetical protein